MEQMIDNRYKIFQVLGSGLSGEVFAVEDGGEKKALKTLKRVQMNVSREEALSNFKSEFSILAELNHPGIGRILDFGFDAKIQKYFFTTELIDGQDFFSATVDKPFKEIEDLAIQVLRALNYLHSRSILHLDIKPQNILVKTLNGKMQAKIIDFGLAGFSSPRKKVGTPAYMAPEVILGFELGPRTDLYSLGVVLYKALTRENPFASKDLKETLNRQKNLVPDPPTRINPKIAAYWDQIIPRLLEKIPANRYPMGADVIRDINFLSNSHYEIETANTRLSYIPEKGNIIGRKSELENFKTLFEQCFKGTEARLLIVEGKQGTGKSRLLSEFKYHSQLNEIPVFHWEGFSKEKATPPFLLQIEETDQVPLDQVNLVLQQFSHERILITWAIPTAPKGWSDCKIISLHNFSEKEVSDYLSSVTGQKNPPQQLIQEIMHRTDGNPLFLTELLKTMLASNLILDETGRWASTTFEDIGINFDHIKVPKTLGGLLLEKFNHLEGGPKEILKWMAIANEAVTPEMVGELTGNKNVQADLLKLIQENIVVRTDRENHYFFSNIMMQDVIYDHLGTETRALHDVFSNTIKDKNEERTLHHVGHGTDDEKAVAAFLKLGDLLEKQKKSSECVDALNQAWTRVQKLKPDIQIEVLTRLAEATITSRNYKDAILHYQYLKEIFDGDPNLHGALDRRILIYEKLGNLYAKLDQWEPAQALFNTALEWVATIPKNEIPKMIIENHLANIFMKSGRLDDALKIFKSTKEQWEKWDEESKKQVHNNWLADLYLMKQEFDLALNQIDQDVAFFEKIEHRYLISRAYYVRGDLYFRLLLNESGEVREAKKKQAIIAFEKALKIAKEINAHDLMLRVYNGIGNLYYHELNYDTSADQYQRALAIARKLEDMQTAATISLNLANIYKIQKNNRDAHSYLIYATNTLESMEQKNSHNWLSLLNVTAEMAENYQALGQLEKAEEALNKVELLLRDHPHLAPYEFWLWLLRAKVYHQQNHTALLKEAMTKASSLVREGLEQEELTKFKNALVSDQDTFGNLPEEALTADTKKSLPMEHSQRMASDLENVLRINKFINSEHNLEHLLKMVINYALDLTNAEAGLVILLNRDNELIVRSSVNTQVDANLTRISTVVARRAVENGEMIITSDALADVRFDESKSIVLNELKSILCVPLKSKNKVIGVLYLDNRYRANAFLEINTRVLNAYADQVGIALENARLLSEYQEVQKRLEEELRQTTDELESTRRILQSESEDYGTKYSYSQIIAHSKPMREVFKLLDKITETPITVYLQGASGTGKELIARALHYNNPQRAKQRFVAINCGAIPENLMESELFGHKAGSFTGATRDKKGLFEEANCGTIFLDEIAELKIDLQVKLLRVIQESEIQRIGDTRPIKINARVVCASHKNLEEMIEKGEFREDLYYRLCQIKIELPPLVERIDDLPLLVEHFIEKFRKASEVKEKIKPSTNLMRVLFEYSWPGNIRELENVINVACSLRGGPILELEDLPLNYPVTRFVAERSSYQGGRKKKITLIDEKNKYNPQKTWAEYEILIIAKCYEKNDFRKKPTTAQLGLSPSTIYNKIRDFDLDNGNNALYRDPFEYSGGTLKDYTRKIFKAALTHSGNHPYTAIRQLAISQGYFYKIMK